MKCLHLAVGLPSGSSTMAMCLCFHTVPTKLFVIMMSSAAILPTLCLQMLLSSVLLQNGGGENDKSYTV